MHRCACRGAHACSCPCTHVPVQVPAHCAHVHMCTCAHVDDFHPRAETAATRSVSNDQRFPRKLATKEKRLASRQRVWFNCFPDFCDVLIMYTYINKYIHYYYYYYYYYWYMAASWTTCAAAVPTSLLESLWRPGGGPILESFQLSFPWTTTLL